MKDTENKKRILLAEDDPFLIDIYTTKLKDSDFDVDTAANGEEILKKAKEIKFDLLILDIVLPHMDGWEIIGKIKSDPASKDLKVIILSNLGQKEEVEKGMKLGAEKYLIKAHYTPSQVVEEIKKII
jgi:DNA-binding response OmpR family regulator